MRIATFVSRVEFFRQSPLVGLHGWVLKRKTRACNTRAMKLEFSAFCEFCAFIKSPC